MTKLPEIMTADQIPLLSKSLGSQDLAKHRATVAFELEVVAKKVDRFGWDRDRGTPAHDRLLTDWMDALQDYTIKEIRSACRQAVLDRPNSCPNEGHIRKIILRERADIRRSLPKPVEPQRPAPCDPETAARIVAELGFTPKKFGGEA